MTESLSSQQEPIFVYDMRLRMFLLTTLATSPALLLILEPAGTGFWYRYWVVPLWLSICLGYGAYSYLTKKRVEFYDDFVRAFSPRGKPTDIPYSQLHLEWGYQGQSFGKGTTSLCYLSLEGTGIYGPFWTVSNVDIKRLNTTLFAFLKQKNGTLTEEERHWLIDHGYGIP